MHFYETLRGLTESFNRSESLDKPSTGKYLSSKNYRINCSAKRFNIIYELKALVLDKSLPPPSPPPRPQNIFIYIQKNGRSKNTLSQCPKTVQYFTYKRFLLKNK